MPRNRTTSVELLWTRQVRSTLATISIVDFAEMIHDPPSRAERELFQSIARAAAERCLSRKQKRR